MMASGREQLSAMTGLGRGKVNKAVKMPGGFGVVSTVFAEFLDAFKDEWRRRCGSDDGAVALANEWVVGLRYYDDEVVLEALSVVKRGYVLPPDLSAFVTVVAKIAEERRQDDKRTVEVGRRSIDCIRGMLSQGS